MQQGEWPAVAAPVPTKIWCHVKGVDEKLRGRCSSSCPHPATKYGAVTLSESPLSPSSESWEVK